MPTENSAKKCETVRQIRCEELAGYYSAGRLFAPDAKDLRFRVALSRLRARNLAKVRLLAGDS